MSSTGKSKNAGAAAAAATGRFTFEPLSTTAATASKTGGLILDPFTRLAGAALLCGATAHYLSSRQTELASELLCWAVLPFVFDRANKRHQHVGHSSSISRQHARNVPSLSTLEEEGSEIVNGNGSENGRVRVRVTGKGKGRGEDAVDVPAASLWIVAISLAICSVYRSERGFIVLFPLLIPLLLISQKFLQPDISSSFEIKALSIFSRLTTNAAGATLTALFAVFALSQWDPFGYAISLAPVAALVFIYTLLTPQTNEALPRWLQSFDMQANIRPLSIRVVATLAFALSVETVVFGFPSVNVVETVASALAKALAWYFASQVARHTSWLTATMAGTFGLLATRNPSIQETGFRALMNAVASLLALGQTIDVLPKQAKAKPILWGLAFVPVLPYLANLASISMSQSQGVTQIESHPVEVLIREAKADFENMLQNQSKSYAEAYDEYQRRYGYEPPYGFEEWYNFAKSHQSPIIDEFDGIFESVSPFLRLSGQGVLDVMTQVYSLPEHELWRCTMSGHPSKKTYCSHPRRSFDRNVSKFLDKLFKKLPQLSLNVKLLINHLDEPAVIIPPPGQDPRSVNLTNLAGQRSWDTLTKYCSARRTTSVSSERKPPVETYGLPFLTDRRAAIDLCAHPEYASMHGFLLAPESLKLIEGLVPVLSTGAPSTMGDILYPLAAYTQDPSFKYDRTQDVDWDKKRNALYWAGSNTGGRGSSSSSSFSVQGEGGEDATGPIWRLFHRQRFVELAQNLKSRTYYYLRSNDNIITRVSSSFLNSRLYSVAFARIFQCSESRSRACRDQRAYFRQKPWTETDRPLFRSKLVFDLDGNGISGRWYKLLASKSTPLKQTIFREWHDERLAPWVHYVPVSQSMDELPELVHYLTSTKSGRERAREIAEQGRHWFGKAFREIDMAIYVYRLLLELARLQDPDRPTIEFDVG